MISNLALPSAAPVSVIENKKIGLEKLPNIFPRDHKIMISPRMKHNKQIV